MKVKAIHLRLLMVHLYRRISHHMGFAYRGTMDTFHIYMQNLKNDEPWEK